jgi:predicted GNAT family acetyltransferase
VWEGAILFHASFCFAVEGKGFRRRLAKHASAKAATSGLKTLANAGVGEKRMLRKGNLVVFF